VSTSDNSAGSRIHAFLLAGRYAKSVAFPADDQLVPPNELLYRRAVVLAPGRFDNVGQLHTNLIQDTLAQLPEEERKGSKGEIGLICLSEGKGMHIKEIVERVKTLNSWALA